MILLYRSIIYLLQIIEILIVVRIIFSFLNVGRNNKLISLVYELTEPVLGPARLLIEKIGIRTGMFDFSPILAVLFLRLISDFIKMNLMWFWYNMRIDRDKYINHIQDNNRAIEMRQILDKIEIVMRDHLVESTDFLDPYSRLLAKSIMDQFPEIDYLEQGGLKESERQIITIYPDYYYLEDKDLNITALRIRGNFDNLSHRDFLGSILGLGINRSKIGDILLHEDFTDIIVKKEISSFIEFNLEKVANNKTSIEEIKLEDLIPAEIFYKEIQKTLSSYRLDVYISGAYNLSRGESTAIIKSGNVKVNWEPIDKSSKELEIGDIISIRGYGRSILHSVEGLSKKGKIKSKIRILI